MTREQLGALKEYIEAVIDEKIQEAFGRDSGSEYLRRHAAEEALEEGFNL
jgi:CHASE1-domain containing sensor protein